MDSNRTYFCGSADLGIIQNLRIAHYPQHASSAATMLVTSDSAFDFKSCMALHSVQY